MRGFDSEDRGGRSEPTSPDRRERAGTTNTCRGQPRTRCLEISSALHPAQPLGRDRSVIQSGLPSGTALWPDGTSQQGWGHHRPPVSGGDPRLTHRLRSEKSRRQLGRPGFDSRHLHQTVISRQPRPSERSGFSTIWWIAVHSWCRFRKGCLTRNRPDVANVHPMMQGCFDPNRTGERACVQ